MRILVLIVMAALAGSCSCERKPEKDPAPSAEATVEAKAEAGGDGAAEAAKMEEAIQLQEDRQAVMSRAVSGLHSYLGLAAAKNWPKADAFWVGGKPPPRPDDHAFRAMAIEGLRSMRINNDPPVPLDQESPPRALEIPVTLRVRREDGTRELKGWYRMRRKIDSDDWEITSASMQLTLD